MNDAGGPLFLGDKLRNLYSGMGTDKDKLALGRFEHRFIDGSELRALYENNWIAGKIIDAPVDDMTREWRVWNGGRKQVAAIEAAEKALGIRQRLNKAMKMARLSGGAVLFIGTGEADPSKPLNPERVKRGGVKYVQALSRWEIVAGPLDRDMFSPHYGSPEYYELHSINGKYAQVHPSRVVRFLGQAPLDITTSIHGWGLPTLQRVYDAVNEATAVGSNLASLTFEAKVDVFGIPRLTTNVMDPNYRDSMLMRFSLANTSKSVHNAVLMDAEETWEQKQITFAGFPEIIRAYLEVVAGAADMPATRLLGIAPKGLNATGQSDIRNYYDMLAARQEVELRPALTVLDEVLCRHAGVSPGTVTFSWLPLWQMTEAEATAIHLQKAQTTEIYGAIGALPPSALAGGVQAQLVADKVYPGLDDLLTVAKESNEEPAPLIAPADMVEKNAPKSGPVKT